MSMLFLIFYFVLASVLLFQGLHMVGEVKSPLGTVPEEVGQEPARATAWGTFLLTFAVLALVVGVLGFALPFFESLRPAIFSLGSLGLVVFGAWVIFMGRTVNFIGTPSVDHGHDDHGHH
jgi:hypothetical protein